MVANYNEILHKNEKIELENLILRKFKDSDAEDFLEYVSDAKTLEYLGWEKPSQSIQDARNEIYNYALARPGIYAIEQKSNAKCIGEIGLALNIPNERATVSYLLNRKYWGRGIMSEALNALLKLCFEKLELNRVEADHFIGNEASGRVLEKCGLRKEGIARGVFKDKGVFRDEVRYGILRSEWMERL